MKLNFQITPHEKNGFTGEGEHVSADRGSD